MARVEKMKRERVPEITLLPDALRVKMAKIQQAPDESNWQSIVRNLPGEHRPSKVGSLLKIADRVVALRPVPSPQSLHNLDLSPVALNSDSMKIELQRAAPANAPLFSLIAEQNELYLNGADPKGLWTRKAY
eukprot:c18696_g1_i2.p1 GENE.c18696_g1_i2~~c18696_g1_i2.p1  ORF type:complete len:132 (+),score=19.79 c18696_g1_i2:21-416(+)